MSVAPTSPITGAAQTGFTAPTYTHVADTAPDSNGKQVAVTALGGTQTGVDVGSVSKPFTITFVRPKVLKVLGTPNPVTGIVSNVPNNTYVLITRKGVLPLAGQPNRVMVIRTSFEVPAGSDSVEPEDIRAAISAHIGYLNQQSAGIGDTCCTGIM